MKIRKLMLRNKMKQIFFEYPLCADHQVYNFIYILSMQYSYKLDQVQEPDCGSRWILIC